MMRSPGIFNVVLFLLLALSPCTYGVTCPSIVAPPDVTHLSTRLPVPLAEISLGEPVTDPDCPGVTVTRQAPSLFPAGITTVIYVATDRTGATAMATQQVGIVPAATINLEASLLSTGGGTPNKRPLSLDLKIFDQSSVGSPPQNEFGATWTNGPMPLPDSPFSGFATPPTVEPDGLANLYKLLVPSSDPVNSTVASGFYLVIGKAVIDGTAVYPGFATSPLGTGTTLRVFVEVLANPGTTVALPTRMRSEVN